MTRTTPTQRWLAALGALLVAALVAWVVVDGEDDSAHLDIGVTLSEVTEEPGDHYGDFVVVSGEVRELAPDDVERGGDGGGARVPVPAFAIGDDSRDEQLLVVGAPGNSFGRIEPGLVVQVEGIVREFGGAQLAAALEQPGRFDGDWFAEWEGKPALLATSVDPTPPAEIDEPGPAVDLRPVGEPPGRG